MICEGGFVVEAGRSRLDKLLTSKIRQSTSTEAKPIAGLDPLISIRNRYHVKFLNDMQSKGYHTSIFIGFGKTMNILS